MSWSNRLPGEISNVRRIGSGFTGEVAVPVDNEGFFGRSCQDCGLFFKVLAAEWSSVPTATVITCPYCGKESADPSDFFTPDQTSYLRSAGLAMGEQYAHEAISNMLSGFGGTSRPRVRSGMTISVRTSPAPRTRSLEWYREEEVLRVLACDNCGKHHAVYGATAFCPYCGPRATIETVLESIDRARSALALPDILPEEHREQFRAQGVFDREAETAVKEVATIFEVFAREQFKSRIPNADTFTVGRGNLFQRLADTDALFGAHAGFALSSVVPLLDWQLLQVVFQQRHILTHQGGRIDQQYLDRVTSCTQSLGQKLTISRRDAESALGALEAAIKAIAAEP
jgi:sarcosine oxidase delta subunit